jgi:kynurenine aminotransferase
VPEAFAATGWRVGWLIGPQSIIGPTLAACTRIVFCSNSPLQEAAAAGLEQAAQRSFFENQVKEYQERRDVLISAFDKLGLKYSLPEGSYFVLLVRAQCIDNKIANHFVSFNFQDISRVKFPEDYPFPLTIQGRGRDFKFVHRLFCCVHANDHCPGHAGSWHSKSVYHLSLSARYVR